MTRNLDDLRHLVKAPIVNGNPMYFRPEAVIRVERIGQSGNTKVTFSDSSSVAISASISTVVQRIDEAIRRDLASS